MKRFLICWLAWMLVFHWWIILHIAPIRGGTLGWIAFIQGIYWINIPGLPLARVMGPQHFPTGEFGILPAGQFEYMLIGLFWMIIAALLGFGSSTIWNLFGRSNEEESYRQ